MGVEDLRQYENKAVTIQKTGEDPMTFYVTVALFVSGMNVQHPRDKYLGSLRGRTTAHPQTPPITVHVYSSTQIKE